MDILSPFATKYEIRPEFSYNASKGKLEVSCHYLDRGTGELAKLKGWTAIKPGGGVSSGISASKGAKVSIADEELRWNPYLYVAFDRYRKFIRLPDLSGDFSVEFFPEGGYLVPGTSNKVGFKALGGDGLGVPVSGTVTDSKGTPIAHFESVHAGMGYFTLYPETGESYTAQCESGGKEVSVKLPDPDRSAVIVSATEVGSRTVFHAATADTSRTDSLRLVLHQRGILVCDTVLRPGGDLVSVDRRILRNGVLNVVLFDRSGNALSERIVFVDNGLGTDSTAISADRGSYGFREKATIRFRPGIGTGSFAASVTDDKSRVLGNGAGIISSLLLCSELRGNIEDSGFYFDRAGTDSSVALDALMLTQGWRRYDIPALVSTGKVEEPRGEMEIGQEITGTVFGKWSGKPESGASVSVLIPKYGCADIFPCGEDGRFRLNGFDFPENTSFLISATDGDGKKLYPNIAVDNPVYPRQPWEPASRGEMRRAGWEVFVSGEGTRFRTNGMGVTLDEIIVNGFKLEPYKDFFQATAFRSFSWEDMEKKGATCVKDVLRTIAGLNISTDGYMSYRGNNVGLVIDGVPQRLSYDANREFDAVNTLR